MNKRYRQDYDGEFVVLNTNIRLGIKQQKREWIPNTLTETAQSRCAAVIASTGASNAFDYQRLVRHRGGLLGKNKLKLYGTSNVWQFVKLDYYCSTDRHQIAKINDIDDCKTYCFTTSRLCMLYPGKFYLVPLQPPISDLGLAVYLAAFDGYRDIYLIGFPEAASGLTRNWQQDVLTVMQTYNDHAFYACGSPIEIPESWKNLPNVQILSYKKFVTACDL